MKELLKRKLCNQLIRGGYRNKDCKINLKIARPLTTDQNKRAGTTNYISKDVGEEFNLTPENVKNLRIRKFTPKEAWRLMGFSDKAFEKTKAVPTSDTQLYKQAGNSIVVDCLYYILKNLIVDKTEKKEPTVFDLMK